jgi:type IV secretion system protein VirD4
MSNIIEAITKDLKSIPKTLKDKLKGQDTKKILLMTAPYVVFGYVANKVSWFYGKQSGDNTFQKALDTVNSVDQAFKNPLPSLAIMDLTIGIGCGVGIWLAVYYKKKNAKKFRKGEEYGSARWGNEKDIEPYVDPVFGNNVLLTETERLMMSGRPKSPKYARNKNILVIGGSGSGKTRFFVKPNLMQLHSSYVVTDPKGRSLLR